MFAGKSTELLRRLNKYKQAHCSTLLVKYADDDSAVLTTHDNDQHTAVPALQLEDIRYQSMNVDVIAIDEGQFFSDLATFCDEMALTKKVIVAALDGTFERKPFTQISELISKCEFVQKLTAVCFRCHENAAFTFFDKLKSGSYFERENYNAVCRKCWVELNAVKE